MKLHQLFSTYTLLYFKSCGLCVNVHTWKSQLNTDNFCIIWWPLIVFQWFPSLIRTDLNTTVLLCVSFAQSNLTIWTGCFICKKKATYYGRYECIQVSVCMHYIGILLSYRCVNTPGPKFIICDTNTCANFSGSVFWYYNYIPGWHWIPTSSLREHP